MATVMTSVGSTLDEFRSLFVARRDYLELINHMSLKERALDWKPATPLEERLKKSVVSAALVKTGAGVMRVTSYLIRSDDREALAYISYGGGRLNFSIFAGGRLNLLNEGRNRDVGFFLTASETDSGLRIVAESKRQYYFVRRLVVNAFVVIPGLFLGVIPGVVALVLMLFVEPWMYRKRFTERFQPVLITALEEAKKREGTSMITSDNHT